MGVGMINTVLFMAVIFCGVWNIAPRRLRWLKKKKQASWCANFHRGRGVFVFVCFFQFSVCIYPFSCRREAINEIFLHIVANKRALLQARVWPVCVWADHWNLPRVPCGSLIIHTRLLWKHLCEQRYPPSLLSSISLPSVFLSLSIFSLHRLTSPLLWWLIRPSQARGWRPHPHY